ncbi:conjugative transfer system coupling protein TraD [Undibacterium oligocarboniphilum]|uniref:Conjugative transfer system coupling protein TraD n=1 Tax=Undibacterium oligocarboniphilum TaxID=666702 RepID=A0A850QIR1_9BURK|nr:conjugative transfer system coupling protein TraD [Undibacterium oligocarboniphilum]MBC3871415.1 conjugative transfer system coupling protein TraD [Undibacterium oligocarboniphilum]NVO79009.1 conjugative transfer system coupling protein TraD [Undibacterium oligocarboniphilum]
MIKNWFRPLYELNALIFWSIASLLMLVSHFPYKYLALIVMLTMTGVRGITVEKMLRFRLSLSVKYLQIIFVKDLYLKSDEALKQKCLYLGEGYEWDQEKAQLSNDLLGMPKADIPAIPGWLPDPLVQHLMPKNIILDKCPVDIGKPWIKALSIKIGPVIWPLKAIEGHTLIAGTTGAGKTRTYELISTQIIRMGKGVVLIIIDPKNDQDLKNRVKKECKKANKKFLYFKQAEPGKSIRLNPLANWNQPSEIATRISQLMEDGPFRSFAHLFIDRVVKGELYVGDRPNLRSIFGYVQGRVDPLLERCLVKFFTDLKVVDFELKARGGSAGKSSTTYLDGLLSLYNVTVADHKKMGRNVQVEAIDGLMATYTHDRDHYSKIIATLLPLLQMLATGETGLMLAPDVDDLNDTREIWDTQRVINQDAVLYIGMDSLSNSEVAKAVNSMILAEIASVAGAIYNFVEEKNRKQIYLLIDEVAEAINEQVIQVLNKGRGAGFRAFVALQTIKDLEAKLNSAPKMLQVLGNLNNQIILRLEDSETVKWVIEKMGETKISEMNTGYSQGTGTEQHIFEFSGNISRSEKRERTSLIPKELILGLPNLQYFARFTGGHISTGTIPIIED